MKNKIVSVQEAIAIIRDGAFEETTDTVRVITGRDARSFADFARDHSAKLAPLHDRAQQPA